MSNGRSNVRANRFDRGYLKGFRAKSPEQKTKIRHAINNGKKLINSDGIFSCDVSIDDINLVRLKLTKLDLSDIHVVHPQWIVDMMLPAVGQEKSWNLP